VVIFTSVRFNNGRGYGRMAERMIEMATQQPGFLGIESARETDGFGITVSYWNSEQAIAAWNRIRRTHLHPKLRKHPRVWPV
jgi:heme-degrading monooxygenase HmoA